MQPDRERRQIIGLAQQYTHRRTKKPLTVRMTCHIPSTPRDTRRSPACKTSRSVVISAERHDKKTLRRRAASPRHDGARYQRHWCHDGARRQRHWRETTHRKTTRFGKTNQKEESVRERQTEGKREPETDRKNAKERERSRYAYPVQVNSCGGDENRHLWAGQARSTHIHT